METTFSARNALRKEHFCNETALRRKHYTMPDLEILCRKGLFVRYKGHGIATGVVVEETYVFLE